MTKDEALKLALEALEYPGPSWLEARQPAITAIKEALAQPEHELWAGVDFDIKTIPPQPEERNFCSRCGKRTADLTTIHTCTPPQENT
jgi:hypothetical protein